MLCRIYRTTFEINHNKKIRRAIVSMQAGSGRYDYNYLKASILQPLIEPYNFHFNEWELIIWDFNPENLEHWTYFSRYVCCGLKSIKDIDFLNEWSSDWMPKDAKKRLETSYVVYKIIDENNNIIDTRPYIKCYLDILQQRLQERRALPKPIWKGTSTERRSFYRHPRTTNEKRQNILPDDERWMRENGYHVKQRGHRKHLPTVYDDILVNIPRCWKDRTKQKTQYAKGNKKEYY